MTNIVQPLAIRFWRNVDKGTPAECWTWKGAGVEGGYGKIGHRGKKVYAHRVSYELHNGPIPDGLVIDHLCNRPSCVNPSHLEAVTQHENLRRAGERQTHCKRGHDYSEPGVLTYYMNTLRDGSKSPGRVCRICVRERAATYRAKRRAGAA